MATKDKYYERNNAEDIFFLSRNESTLPSKSTIVEAIKNCVPNNYSSDTNYATCNHYISKTKIHYDVNQVYPNGYKTSLYYEHEATFLGYIVIFICIIFGVYIGDAIGQMIGSFIGLFVGVLLGVNITESNTGEQDCERIANGIREYERAHIMNI